ncbi:MAG TPA: DUF4410 domain-containing protein [Candidatus Sulfotelmatobacter sp.]|nr:DUF4410 domain-containing protein [Candidatus Sulfotelmatobacter sp.]
MRTHFLVFAFLASCALAAILVRTAPAAPPSFPQEPAITAHNFSRDAKVWVSDFELDAGGVKTDKGGIVGEVRPGILERPRKRREQDPEVQARKIVDLMAKSIVEDLEKAGYKAERLLPGSAQPAMGAWVRGVFTEVDEGNRRRRAIVGFGSGEAKMDLYVTLTDLAAPQKPLYEVANNENSGKKIGAVITMNPYVAAAKFVMEKQAPEKTVKKTASDIAKEVETHL